MAKINLQDAELARMSITQEQEKEISALYHQIYKEYKKEMDSLPLKGKGTTSQSLRKAYLNKLTKQLKEAYEELDSKLESQIKSGMEKTAQATVDGVKKWTQKAGLTVEGVYSYVPKDVVSMLSTGKLYGEGWTLSKSLWGQEQKTLHDIDQIVAKGVAANKSAYDIAKDLEKYVNPSAKKEWDWSKVYPGTSKKIDYNAQRLARTMVSHAYQQSLLATTKYNPFVKGYRWRSAHSSRTCEICNERDGKLYSADNLPLDHPNGMCTFIAELTDDMSNIANRIGDWAQGKEDPELDTWSKALYQGFEPESKTFQGSQPNYSNWVEKSSTLTHEDYDRLSKLTQATLSDKEKKAAKLYSIDSYEEMNKYLRLIGEGKTTEQAERISGIEDYQLLAVKRLTSGMQNSMLPEGLVLRRGTGWKELSQRLNIPSNELSNLSISELNKLASGTVSETHGFLSTGFGYNSGLAGEVESIIYAPKGTSAISMQGLTGFEDEREVLLNSGTKIRILGVEKSDGHMGSSIRVFMEVIQ